MSIEIKKYPAYNHEEVYQLSWRANDGRSGFLRSRQAEENEGKEKGKRPEYERLEIEKPVKEGAETASSW